MFSPVVMACMTAVGPHKRGHHKRRRGLHKKMRVLHRRRMGLHRRVRVVSRRGDRRS